jgi:hypothetical protein
MLLGCSAIALTKRLSASECWTLTASIARFAGCTITNFSKPRASSRIVIQGEPRIQRTRAGRVSAR